MKTGKEIVEEWENGSYDTHKECMAKLVKLIDDNIRLKAAVKINKIDVYNEIDFVDSYHERQQSLRKAGFDAYSCDEIDEFPSFNR